MRFATVIAILLLLCGVGICAELIPPTPSPLNNIQEKQTAAKHSNLITNTEQNVRFVNPIAVSILPAPNAETKAATQEKAEEKKAFNDRLIACSTVILALVTTALAIFTAFLWKATNKLVGSTKDTAERQLRAYINISHGKVLYINDPQNRIFQLDIKNFGQTPAYEVSTVFKCIVREYPLGKSNPLESVTSEEHQIFSVLGPTCEYRRDMIAPYNGEWVEPKIIDGSAAIYGFGEIRYRDAFGVQRVTEFRYMCQGEGITQGCVAPCEEGNNAT